MNFVRHQEHSEKTDVLLDVTAIILTTLKDAAKLSPLPFLSQAAGIAVSIIDVVQKTRGNKAAFRKLAEDACELVYSVYGAYQAHKLEVMPDDMNENLQQLVHTLVIVYEFAQKRASRNAFKALIFSGVDVRKIQDHREALQQCMRVFGLKSIISLRSSIASLSAHQVVVTSENTNTSFLKNPVDITSGRYFLLPLTFQLRKNEASLKTTTNWETISYLLHLLKNDDYVDVCREVTEFRDVENMMEFIIHVLEKAALPRTDLKHANNRARRLLIKLGIVTNVIPKSLYLDPKAISLSCQLPMSYAGSEDFYKGEYGGIPVAVKRFRRHQMDKHFYREVLTWRSLSHKFILPFMGIYVHEKSGSFVGLVTPLMKNGTLSDWRAACKPTLFEIEQRLSEVTEGLQYLHREGIIHGDLRGTNILLDHGLHVKIANYGISQHSDSTGTSNPMLSFQFSAPELFGMLESNDGDLLKRTTESDVYAFACLYYEIHFGRLPFTIRNPFKIAMAVIEGERPEKLQEPPLDDRAWALICKCWDQDPAERPCMSAVLHIIKSWHATPGP